MPILRKKYVHDFTVVPNLVIRDARLSYKARGIFLYLWHLPDDWEISLSDLQSNSYEDGAASVRTGVAELEQYGYLAYEWRREMGKFSNAEWTLNGKPGSDFPIPVFPNSANPTPPKNSEELRTKNLRTEDSPVIPSGDMPTPKTKRPSKKAPSDFVITETMAAWARESVPGLAIDYETASFCDYEFRNGHSDWVATWRIWMRKAWKDLPADARKTPSQSSAPFKVQL